MRKKLILLASGIIIECLNLLSVLLLFINRSSTALQYNVTIDDQNGDPTNGNFIQYSPQEEWITGQNCTNCDLDPDLRSEAYYGTWTNATYEAIKSPYGHIKQASVTFEGIAVYVICITIDTNKTDDGTNDITFAIDGLTSNRFEKVPVSSSITTFDFNQTVFSMTGLSNSSHTLLMQTGLINQKAVILLDAIIYTKDDGSGDGSAPSVSTQPIQTGISEGLSGSNTAYQPENTIDQSPNHHEVGRSDSRTKLVAGAIGAAITVLCGTGIIIFCLRRRYHHRSSWRKGISPLIIVGSHPDAGSTQANQVNGPSLPVYLRRGTDYESGVPETGGATRASSVAENLHSEPQLQRYPFTRNEQLSPISEVFTRVGTPFSQTETCNTTLPPYEQLTLERSERLTLAACVPPS